MKRQRGAEQIAAILRLRAEQQFQLQSAFNFQRTTVFVHASGSDTATFSRNPPQNR